MTSSYVSPPIDHEREPIRMRAWLSLLYNMKLIFYLCKWSTIARDWKYICYVRLSKGAIVHPLMLLNVNTHANSVIESSFALMKFMEVLMNGKTKAFGLTAELPSKTPYFKHKMHTSNSSLISNNWEICELKFLWTIVPSNPLFLDGSLPNDWISV